MSGKQAKKKRNADKTPGPQKSGAAPAASKGPAEPTRPAAVMIGGLVALSASIVASTMLVIQHFSGASLPGCGAGSGCAELAASAWSKVPGLNLPVAFLGLAFFIAMFVQWAMSIRSGPSNGLPNGLMWLARLGALASAMFVTIMLGKGVFCIYCVVAHAGNLAFWGLAEFGTRGLPRVGKWPVVATAVFLVATGGLFGADKVHNRNVEKQAKALQKESTDKMIERGTQGDGSSEQPSGEPFTGRYRLGPEDAPIRIVAISDFQCPDCKRMEGHIKTLVEERDDVSFSAKHFPMCNSCNRFMGKSNPHPNACWAARAAETAGKLRGNDGYWEMYYWLFDRGGSFTDRELRDGVTQLGYDANEFLSVMQSPEMLALVKEDIEEGKALGLHFTPMIFVNGVQLRGIFGPKRDTVLFETVETLAATNPPRRTAAWDQPDTAAEKYVADWREAVQRSIRGEETAHTRGASPDTARVNISVYGDLQEKNTARLDQLVRGYIADRGDVRYSFQHYPVNTDCNPVAKTNQHPRACIAHKAAEAAFQMGGDTAYWKMHDWLIDNQKSVNLVTVKSGGAAAAGLDPTALEAVMESVEVKAAIDRDCYNGRSMGMRYIPFVFVNGKWVPRWQLDGYEVMDLIVEEAANE